MRKLSLLLTIIMVVLPSVMVASATYRYRMNPYTNKLDLWKDFSAVSSTYTKTQYFTGGIKTSTFTMTNGAVDGYILETDGSGVASWTNTIRSSMTFTEGLESSYGVKAATGVFSGALEAATLNTGQGDYELFAMNQDVETTDVVTFVDVNPTTHLNGNLGINNREWQDMYLFQWHVRSYQGHARGFIYGHSSIDKIVIDGDAGITLDAGTGVIDCNAETVNNITLLTVGNISLSGNTIISDDVNGDINLDPNGTGDVYAKGGAYLNAEAADGDDIWIRHSGSDGWIGTNAGDLYLNPAGNDVYFFSNDLLDTARIIPDGQIRDLGSALGSWQDVYGQYFHIMDWGAAAEAGYIRGNSGNIRVEGEIELGNGAGGNYTLVETTGTLVFNGDATVWDDLRVPISAIRLGGAQPPTETMYKGGAVLAFPSNANKTIYFNAQMPHSYKEESDIEFHIHYAIPTSGAGGGAENVKWDFTYSWSSMDAAIPNATTETATFDVQGSTADIHYYGEIIEPIAGAGQTISSMLICSLTRDVAVADDYADNVYIMEVDFHFEIDTVGSREEGSK